MLLQRSSGTLNFITPNRKTHLLHFCCVFILITHYYKLQLFIGSNSTTNRAKSERVVRSLVVVPLKSFLHSPTFYSCIWLTLKFIKVVLICEDYLNEQNIRIIHFCWSQRFWFSSTVQKPMESFLLREPELRSLPGWTTNIGHPCSTLCTVGENPHVMMMRFMHNSFLKYLLLLDITV